MSSDTSTIRPVILCGGAGTRLWPVSREQFPKQLLALTGEMSLLQHTAERFAGPDFAPALIVSAEEQRFFIKRQLHDAGVAIEAILLEPVARNTAAAIGLAAAWLSSTNRDELMLVVPSDHVIGDQDAFIEAVRIAASHAARGAIVTFGVKPTEANTQYGYIEAEATRSSSDGALPIASFHEKPDAARAAQYLESGRHFWNCGIFLVKASTYLDEMRLFLGESFEEITKAVGGASRDDVFLRPNAEHFARAQNISIDHGIMEKTHKGVVVPVDMRWSDVGAWDAVWKLGEKDADNNVTYGQVLAVDTRNSLLRAEGNAIVTGIGLDSLAVIAVRDAIFVAPIGRASQVKDIVAKLKGGEQDYTALPAKVARPWGSYETIASGPRFQVKHIVVDPGETLSLQMHYHRSEHWVIVRGSAEVTVGDQVLILQENESTFIPAGTRHRLANPGKVPVEVVEIQCGPYLGEDDIVRFDDQYGRA